MVEMDNNEYQAAISDGKARITAVVPEKSGTVRRTAIHVDGRMAIYARPPDAEGLAAGDRIQDDQLKRLQARYERGAYLQAGRFLGRRDRSVHEVRQHLQAKGWDESACVRALEKLNQEGLVGDQDLAYKWIDYRARTSPRSRRAMIQELQRRGIDREIVHKAVAPMDEKALALACARKKQRQWQRYPEDERLRRIMAFLQRKGFPYAVCRETARILTGNAPDD